jgi:hypothetical protein
LKFRKWLEIHFAKIAIRCPAYHRLVAAAGPAKKQWPKIRYKEKRTVTAEVHAMILVREPVSKQSGLTDVQQATAGGN